MLEYFRRQTARLGQAPLILPLCAAVLAVAFGTGHEVVRKVQHDGGTWTAFRGQGVHLNGATREPDAVVKKPLGQGNQQIRFFESPDGTVYAFNYATGVASRINPLAVKVEARTRQHANAGSLLFLAGGERTYLVDKEQGLVRELDRTSLKRRREVPVDARVVEAVADRRGTLWLLDNRGQVRRLGERLGPPIPVVGEADPAAQLTLVQDRPVVVIPSAGQVVPVRADGRGTPILVPALVDATAVHVSPPESSGASVWLALEGREPAIVGVGVGRGEVRRAQLEGLPGNNAKLGRPVAANGRVFVPEHTPDRSLVHTLDARTLTTVTKPLKIPVRNDIEREGFPPFEIRLDKGTVWIHDQFANTGVAVTPDGRARPLDKTSQPGAPGREDSPPATTPPTTTEPPETEPPANPPVTDPPDTGDDREQPEGDGDPDAPPEDDPAPEEPELPLPDPTVTVPDLVGTDAEAACATLEQEGLNCQLEVVAGQDGGEPGTVQSTDPAAGTKVLEGRLVTVHYLEADPGAGGGEHQGEGGEHEGDGGDDGNEVPQPAPDPAPAPQQPQQVTVPNITGMPMVQACETLKAANLVCQTGQKSGPLQPEVIHTQQPAAGSPAQPKTDVKVLYDIFDKLPLQRLKRADQPIWAIGTNGTHIQNLAENERYNTPKTIAQAYPKDARAPGLRQIHSFAKGDRLQYTISAEAPGAGWQRQGTAAVVLEQQAPESIPLYRLVRQGQGGEPDYGYAANQNGIDFLTSRGFQIEQVLGYVWPP